MLISAVVCTVWSVPDVRKLCHGCWLFLVDLFDEFWVYRSAVAMHSAAVDFQSVGNQFFVACHDVCQISEALWCVAVCSDVNVNPCTDSCVADCSGFAKLSDQFLQGFDVLVFQDWGYQFAFFAVCSGNGNVSLKFPFSALCIPCWPGAVAVSACCVFVSVCSEEVGGKPCSSFSGDVVHFDFHSDGLVFHVFNLSFCFSVHCFSSVNSGFLPFRCVTYYRITEDKASG